MVLKEGGRGLVGLDLAGSSDGVVFVLERRQSHVDWIGEPYLGN